MRNRDRGFEIGRAGERRGRRGTQRAFIGLLRGCAWGAAAWGALLGGLVFSRLT
jgi:hypothetical protein